MGLFDFLKKKSVLAKEQKSIVASETNLIKKAYVSLLEKYTSISSSCKNVDKNAKKRLTGTFANGFDCSMFSVSTGGYAIRFKDDMRPDEFYQIFAFLQNDLGTPNTFSEYHGYIWKQKGYIITFGLVTLNHNYDVPMICVRRNASVFSATVPYSRYNMIADAINKPLHERGIDPQKNNFYKLAYSKLFGYSIFIDLEKSMLSIDYKNKVLEVTIIPLRQDGEVRAIETQKQHREQVLAVDVSMIEKKLDQLLEATKAYHGLNKFN